MGKIKHNTPGPNLGTPQPGGKTGNINDFTSTEGGQYPFLPSAGSHLGSNPSKKSPGQSEGTTKTDFPFLPKKSK